MPFLAKLGGQHLEASQPCKRNPVSRSSIISQWDFYLALTQYKCNRRQNTYIHISRKQIPFSPDRWSLAWGRPAYNLQQRKCSLWAPLPRQTQAENQGVGDNFVTVNKTHLNSCGVDSFVVEELLDSLGHCHVLRQVQTTHLQNSRIYETHHKN